MKYNIHSATLTLKDSDLPKDLVDYLIGAMRDRQSLQKFKQRVDKLRSTADLTLPIAKMLEANGISIQEGEDLLNVRRDVLRDHDTFYTNGPTKLYKAAVVGLIFDRRLK